MAVQILDRPGSGQIAAMSFGRGLDQLLGGIARKTQLDKQSKGFESLGMTKEQAKEIVNLPPKLQEIALNRVIEQQKGAAYARALSGKDSAQPFRQDQSFAGEGSNLLQNLAGRQQQTDISGAIQPEQNQLMQNLTGRQQQADIGSMQPQQAQVDQGGRLDYGNLEGLTAPQIEQVIALRSKEQEFKRSSLERKDKREYDRKNEAHKASVKQFEKINSNYEKAIEEKANLKRLSKLIDSGNLDSPSRSYIINNPIGGKVGTGIGALLGGLTTGGLGGPAIGAAAGGLFGGSPAEYKRSPESQEFHKIAEIMAMNRIQRIGGGRVTDAVLDMARSTVPSLEQSTKGKEKVINNLLLENEKDILKYKAMNSVIEKNKGFRPANFDAQVNKIYKKELKKLKERLKKKSLYKSKAPYKPATSSTYENIKELLSSEYQEEPEKYAQYQGSNSGMLSFLRGGLLN